MTLSELASEAMTRGDNVIFFQINESDEVYTVYLSRSGSPEVFSVFKNSTNTFVEVNGDTKVQKSAAPTGRGHYGFCDG